MLFRISQALRQISVKLNHGERPKPLHQRLCQRRKTGADFHHVLPRLGCNGIDNRIDDSTIRQKMLTKPLAGNVLHLHSH